MEFRDLHRQYQYLQKEIDAAVAGVLRRTDFIMGKDVAELEQMLADFAGVKHCISCANGTDALQLALMAWGIGDGDAVFVPDFTFFSSGEVVPCVGAVPVFVDVCEDSFNLDPVSLEKMIQKTSDAGRWKPRAVVAVDLFGQPAEYEKIREITERYDLLLLEDAAQGFGGRIGEKKACSFGDISTTSFFPAKPLGCYGDGGAIFTEDDAWAELLRSLRVHGKGSSKYDNVRIGMNSRLDTLQAAVLRAKLPVFATEELERVQHVAEEYTKLLQDVVKTPVVREGYYSSWAQYTIQLPSLEQRDGLQMALKEKGIPTAVYYQKAMHRQDAFAACTYDDADYPVTNRLTQTVLSLPFHPYLKDEEIEQIADVIKTLAQ